LSQIGKTFGKFEDWQQPVLDVAQRLPVGESIEVDFGPVTGPRKYHAKISRKTTTTVNLFFRRHMETVKTNDTGIN
jgi:hypothetical protein